MKYIIAVLIIILLGLFSLVISDNTCIPTSEETEGPYYIADMPFRQIITEGRPGLYFILNITILDVVNACKPLSGAIIDIWHCDATGSYSAYPNTYMRGKQISDSNGRTQFISVFPGWYDGRTTHIHLKVWYGDRTVHTGQMYFNESMTILIHEQIWPYTETTTPMTTQAQDGIFLADGLCNDIRYIDAGNINMGLFANAIQYVNSSATPSAVGIGGPGGIPGSRPPRSTNATPIQASPNEMVSVAYKHWTIALAVILAPITSGGTGFGVIYYLKRKQQMRIAKAPIEEEIA